MTTTRTLIMTLPLVVAAACSQTAPPTVVDRCPPKSAPLASSSPRLSASGKGQSPREEPVTSAAVTTEPGTSRLASGGRGVMPRVECQ